MFMSPAKILFMFTLMLGTLISVTSTSWLGIWMGLEINLLSFIPLMTNTKNIMSTEAALKYFLIQALASALLLFSIIIMSSWPNLPLTQNNIFYTMISSTLLLKMGAAPFHFWFPGVMEGLSWENCFILMTWQKIAPLMLLSYVLETSMFITFIILSSIIIGSLGGLNQSSLRKLMAYSSINHVGWMISAMTVGENMWELYFLIYLILSLSIILMFSLFEVYHINQNFLTLTDNRNSKVLMFLLLLSLGGLPPFLGFLPKWLIIQTLSELNYQFTIVIMVITTLITLFYYLRLTFTAFLFSYTELKSYSTAYYNPSTYLLILVLTSLSTLGLPISSILYYML
uniref:NADH-ubiquinone oxidoreductase chain 2 n=1 Tax=Zichya baranovi TaxID=441242 RepID=A0A1Q1MP53_9ORTH|nr:NADH dehydrogenase subunit 2 [Zichya baranovi]AQM39863.1 NADH dehydrogenase subunit 2 [Zichya baranovi]